MIGIKKDMTIREIVFTGGTNTATISCRQCGKSKTVDLTRLHNTTKQFKVKCPCGSAFEVVFEKRRHPRKRVNLTGHLLDCQTRQLLAEVTITALSLNSITFTPPLREQLSLGDRVRISFVLDDASKAVVEEDIIIRNIREEVTGAEFAAQDYHYNLDFYLSAHSDE